MALQQITPVNALPTDPPDHANLVGKVFRMELGSALEVLARASGGVGTVWLGCWRPEIGSGKWTPWGADASSGPMDIDSGKKGGWAHGVWPTGLRRSGDFCVIVEGGPPPTIAEAWIGSLTVSS